MNLCVMIGQTFYFAVINKKGEATVELVKNVIDAALLAMSNSWPKSMRWGENTIRWARPLHSIVCLFDGSVIPVVLGPVLASDKSAGHRFLAPKLFSVKNFADYKAKLNNAKVFLDAEERRQKIKAEAQALAQSEQLKLNDDPFTNSTCVTNSTTTITIDTTINLKDGTSPITAQEKSNPNLIYVLMPMRV